MFMIEVSYIEYRLNDEEYNKYNRFIECKYSNILTLRYTGCSVGMPEHSRIHYYSSIYNKDENTIRIINIDII